jgi:hypothetical protein
MPLPELLYYDLIVSNIDDKKINPPSLTFQTSRTSPYLMDPRKYKLSIVRWQISNTNSLPIWRVRIKPDSPTANDTIYSVVLEYQGVSFRQYMEYEPQNKVIPVPPAPITQPNGLQNDSTLYYDVYNYSYVIYLMNQTFKKCFAGLSLLIDLPTTHVPYMSYDSATNIAMISCDVEFYSLKIEDPIKIFFNSSLGNIFSSFPFTIQSLTNDGKNFQLQTDIFSETSIEPFPPYEKDPLLQYDVLQIYQEDDTMTSALCPISSIVMTSNSLPTVNSIKGDPQLYYNNSLYQPGNGNLSSPIITDFVAESYSNYIIYSPSIYRYIELVGDQPLYNIDLSVAWQDTLGGINPLLLPTNGFSTVKILFELIK